MEEEFQPGTLLRIKDYEFENGTTRDKYLIILLKNDESAYIIHTLTTSRNNPGVKNILRGCSTHQNRFPYYCFPAGEEIDGNGFYFEKDTFIFFLNNINKVDMAVFQKYHLQPFGMVGLAVLPKLELKRLLKCILKSKFVPNNLKSELSTFKDTL